MSSMRIFLVTLLAAGLSLNGVSLYGQSGTDDQTSGNVTQTQHGFGRGMRGGPPLDAGFVDENSNGINDRLEDDDGDGLINAHDPDHKLFRSTTPIGQGYGFVDENSNGINDRYEDDDGDGVINHLDPDSKYYRVPGTVGGFGFGFVDENANGINDCLEDEDGDGVINALDPDSKYYRDPNTFRGLGRGGMGRGLGSGYGFIDENSNGINDRYEDEDGDGVINHLDSDSKYYRQPGVSGLGRGFVDENANGINDTLEDEDGDGVINALDPDSKYFRPATGRQALGRGRMGTRSGAQRAGGAGSSR
ncbi:MAG TPA: hypothetical protein VM123_00745 [archaeon]|nr:hypothetical protein [archaeon]